MDKGKVKEMKKVWNKLDTAYENLENAFEILEGINGLTDDLQSEIDRFDLSAVSSLKQQVEMMIWNEA